MLQFKIRYLTAMAVGLAALSASAGTLANDDAAPPSRTVRFGDLDLTTQSGSSTLHHRIAAAAREVCPQPDLKDLRQFTLAHACQDAAIERALRAVGEPMQAKLQAARRTLPH